MGSYGCATRGYAAHALATMHVSFQGQRYSAQEMLTQLMRLVL